MQIWWYVLADGAWSRSLSDKRTVPAFTGAEAGAAACFSHGRGSGFYRLRGVSCLRARVTFFFCKKKVTKENHLDLRSKDPLARYGLCKIGGDGFAELVRRVTVSVRGIACTSCAAAADAVRGWCRVRWSFLAIIKSHPLRCEAPQWVCGG